MRLRYWMFAAFAVHELAFAAFAEPLMRLSEGGFGGGGARSWELRLERDGRVVEEWSDAYSGANRQTTLRTMSAAEIESAIARAAALTHSLPKYVDDDGRILVDEETER